MGLDIEGGIKIGVFLVRSRAVFVQFSASLCTAQKYVVQHNHNSFFLLQVLCVGRLRKAGGLVFFLKFLSLQYPFEMSNGGTIETFSCFVRALSRLFLEVARQELKNAFGFPYIVFRLDVDFEMTKNKTSLRAL